MNVSYSVSRRRFFGGLAAATGVRGLAPTSRLFAQGGTTQFRGTASEYDAFAKLASNENNWGRATGEGEERCAWGRVG